MPVSSPSAPGVRAIRPGPLGGVHLAIGGGLQLPAVIDLIDETAGIAWATGELKVLLDFRHWDAIPDDGHVGAVAEHIVMAIAAPGLTVALLFSDANLSHGRLIQTMCRNRGSDLPVFSDVLGATTWLAAR